MMLSFRMLTFSSVFLSLCHIASGKTYLIETVDKKHRQTKMSKNSGNSDYSASDIRQDVPSDRSQKMLTVGGVRVKGLNRKETECLILVTNFQHMSAPLGSPFGIWCSPV